MDKDVNGILLLDLIRKEGGSLSAGGEAPNLVELLTVLVKAELLSIDSEVIKPDEYTRTYKITSAGKRVLHMFDYEVGLTSKPLEAYKEIVVDGKALDGRIPLLAYVMMNQKAPNAKKYLFATASALNWKRMVNMLHESKQSNSAWYNLFSNNPIVNSFGNLEEAWKELGETEEDAKRIAKWLLNPVPANADFIQIRRSY